MTKSASAKRPIVPNDTLIIERTADETEGFAMARHMLNPGMRHAHTASTFANSMFKSSIEKPGMMDFVDVVKAEADRAAGGDLGLVSRMLTAQALTLDNMFSEFARRGALNMGEYLDATERYTRLALKAQTGSRAALEALAKLHQPREQTVRHIHVNDGGQAVITDEFHHHTGGTENANSADQSHAATRAAAAGVRAALPRPEPEGLAMPSASCEGSADLQDARRD